MAQCDRCGYLPKQKSNLKIHLHLKKPCKPILSDISREEMIARYFSTEGKVKCDADICDRYFTTVKGKQRHHARCKHMAALHSPQPPVVSSAPAPHTSVVINNNSNNTTNIQIVAFGQENMQHLLNNRAFVLQCLNNRSAGMCELIEQMHFNPATPQNYNVRKLTKKEPHIDIHDGTRWRTGMSKDALDKLVRGMERLVMEFYNDTHLKGMRINRTTTRRFMEEVGVPLKWDIDDQTDYVCGETFGENTTEKELEESNAELMKLFKKCLYEFTQSYASKMSQKQT